MKEAPAAAAAATLLPCFPGGCFPLPPLSACHLLLHLLLLHGLPSLHRGSTLQPHSSTVEAAGMAEAHERPQAKLGRAAGCPVAVSLLKGGHWEKEWAPGEARLGWAAGCRVGVSFLEDKQREKEVRYKVTNQEPDARRSTLLHFHAPPFSPPAPNPAPRPPHSSSAAWKGATACTSPRPASFSLPHCVFLLPHPNTPPETPQFPPLQRIMVGRYVLKHSLLAYLSCHAFSSLPPLHFPLNPPHPPLLFRASLRGTVAHRAKITALLTPPFWPLVVTPAVCSSSYQPSLSTPFTTARSKSPITICQVASKEEVSAQGGVGKWEGRDQQAQPHRLGNPPSTPLPIPSPPSTRLPTIHHTPHHPPVSPLSTTLPTIHPSPHHPPLSPPSTPLPTIHPFPHHPPLSPPSTPFPTIHHSPHHPPLSPPSTTLPTIHPSPHHPPLSPPPTPLPTIHPSPHHPPLSPPSTTLPTIHPSPHHPPLSPPSTTLPTIHPFPHHPPLSPPSTPLPTIHPSPHHPGLSPSPSPLTTCPGEGHEGVETSGSAVEPRGPQEEVRRKEVHVVLPPHVAL
ncbi:unnamed protein product [Closterium sp. Naga37s-1]|nr:unnamed protein product [Closterium sp. Naga37s-1]